MRKFRESGQALPIYITVVAGLLFLAFAYFAVGQAAASRNGAQSAADAAALAAAQDARNQLGTGLLDSLLTPGNWLDLIEGEQFGTFSACEAAGRFAMRNDASVTGNGCQRLADGRQGFTVKVRTKHAIGESVIPGTEKEHAEATSTAVIVPRCTLKPDANDGEGGSQDPKPEEGEDHKPKGLHLTCDGQPLDIDFGDWEPGQPSPLPSLADLFSVKLAD